MPDAGPVGPQPAGSRPLPFHSRTIALRSPIYSTPLLLDVDGDGRLELFVTAGQVWGWRFDEDGVGPPQPLPGWPQKGRAPFASSPRAGDIDGDGQMEIVAGSDDNAVYAWRLDGSMVPGFPFETGGDIYSTPALVDLDGDGRLEIVFGSDDGCVYAIDGQGRSLPGWPVRTGAFVASSPAVADLDGDGRLEIVIGSWDRRLYVISADGTLWSPETGHPGWPVSLGHILWSSPLVLDADESGQRAVAVAADQLHVIGLDGAPLHSWPARLGGFTPSSPSSIALSGGKSGVAIGGRYLHAFDDRGILRDGFPVDLGGHIWGSPLAFDLDGTGRGVLCAGSWGGAFHVIDDRGRSLRGFPVQTAGPIFGGSAAVRLSDDRSLLVFGSTDGGLRVLEISGSALCTGDERIAGPPPRGTTPPRSGRTLDTKSSVALPAAPANSFPRPATNDSRQGISNTAWSVDRRLSHPGGPIYLRFEMLDPDEVRAGFLNYRWGSSELHPSPLIPSDGRLVGMIQPLPAGTRVQWYLELEDWNGRLTRYPEDGAAIVQVPWTIRGAIRRLVRG